MTRLPMRSSTTQSAPNAEAPSPRAEAVDSKAIDGPVLQYSNQEGRPSSSGNQEEISTNLSVASAKDSVAARYDPMMRWKAETPDEEPWSAAGQFPEN